MSFIGNFFQRGSNAMSKINKNTKSLSGTPMTKYKMPGVIPTPTSTAFGPLASSSSALVNMYNQFKNKPTSASRETSWGSKSVQPSKPESRNVSFGTPQAASSKPVVAANAQSAAAQQLAREAAAIQSGNKQAAVQSSLDYNIPDYSATQNESASSPYKTALSPSKSSDSGTAYTPPQAQFSMGNSVLEALKNKIGSLSAPSAEEAALQDQLAQFRGSAAQGIAGLEGQGRGISLGLVRGQQEKLGTQAALQEQTLMDRITAMAAQRNAALNAAQNEYQIASDEQARQDKLTAPQQVGNSILQYDPTTGQYKTLYTAPAGAENQPASVQEYEYAKKNGYEGSFVDYQNQGGSGSDGAFTLGNTRYDAYGNVIASAPSEADIKTQQADASARTNAQSALDKVIALQGMKGIHQAVGITGSLANIPGSAGANYRAQVESLKAALTLPALQSMKGMGALSDADVRLLNNSVAALNTNMSVKAFESELERIKTVLQSKSGAAATSPADWDDSMKEYYINSGGDPSVFTNDLSKSRNGSWGNLGGLSEKYESGGNPGAVGYDSTGGLSYGTYQLAHNNAQNFVAQSPFKTAFAGLKFNSPQWVAKWKETAQKAPQQFAEAQKAYIAKTHFEPQVSKLKQFGIDVALLPQVVQDAIWSTAVQHGANTDVITKALGRLPKNASPADMLKAIYKERWAGGARFASSTPAVKKSVFNRFFGQQGELATALRSLNTA